MIEVASETTHCSILNCRLTCFSQNANLGRPPRFYFLTATNNIVLILHKLNCIFIISVSWRKVFQYCTSNQLLTKKKELLSSATMSLRAKYSCYIMLPKLHVRPIFFLVLWKLFTRLIIPPEVFVSHDARIRPMDYIYLYMRNFTQICLFEWNIRL